MNQNEFIEKYFMDLANNDIDSYNELLQLCKDIIQDTLDKSIIMIKGYGNNGKTTLLNLLREIMKSDGFIVEKSSAHYLPILSCYNNPTYAIIEDISEKEICKFMNSLKFLTSGNNIYKLNNEIIKANVKFLMPVNIDINIADQCLKDRTKVINMNATFDCHHDIFNDLINYKDEIKEYIINYDKYVNDNDNDNDNFMITI